MLDVQAGFQKGRGTQDHIATICWLLECDEKLQKKINLCFIDYKAFDCIDHENIWVVLEKIGVPQHLIALCVTCVVDKKLMLGHNMERQNGFL